MNEIVNQLIAYKYLIFFPLMVFEGPIVTMIAGFLASLGYFNMYVLYVVAVVGDLAGDLMFYFMGRFSRISIIQKFGKYFGVNFDKLEKLDRGVVENSGKFLLLGKMAQGVGIIPIVMAGVSRVNFWVFLFYSTLGTIPKTLGLILVGYFFGDQFEKMNSIMGYIGLTFTIVLVLIVSLLISKKFNKYK